MPRPYAASAHSVTGDEVGFDLPPELMHDICTIAAENDIRICPTLLQALDVTGLPWLKDIHNAVRVIGERACSVYNERNPALSAVADNVRWLHLTADENDDVATEALNLCQNVEHLYLDHCWNKWEHFLNDVGAMQPRTLIATPSSLFLAWTDEFAFFDTHFFQRMTRLELKMDRPLAHYELTRFYSALPQLPALQNLALSWVPPWGVVELVLLNCPQLLIMLLWCKPSAGAAMAQEGVTKLRTVDQRLVVSPVPRWHSFGCEWAARVNRRVDQWNVAEEFLRLKSLGVLPPEALWVDIPALAQHHDFFRKLSSGRWDFWRCSLCRRIVACCDMHPGTRAISIPVDHNLNILNPTQCDLSCGGEVLHLDYPYHDSDEDYSPAGMLRSKLHDEDD